MESLLHRKPEFIEAGIYDIVDPRTGNEQILKRIIAVNRDLNNFAIGDKLLGILSESFQSLTVHVFEIRKRNNKQQHYQRQGREYIKNCYLLETDKYTNNDRKKGHPKKCDCTPTEFTLICHN